MTRRVTIRVPIADLAAIDASAEAAGITRTRFLLDCALGVSTATDERLEDHEGRLTRLEELAFGV